METRMKKILMATLLFSLLMTSMAYLAATPPPSKAQDQPAKGQKVEKAYVCQACDYVGDKPGKCPKCGKDLVAVNKSDIYYACDMCHVTSDKPGKCPQCGMTMTLKVKTQEPPKSSPDKGPAKKT